jgi:hypothetical protein
MAELSRFAAGGGRLVLEACAGMYDESGTIRPRSLVHELFGLESLELSIAERVEWEWSNSRGERETEAGVRYRQDLTGTAEGIEVIGHFADGCPAAGQMAFGSGETVWVGTLPSVAYARFGRPERYSFIAQCFESQSFDEVIVFRSESLFDGKLTHRLFATANALHLVVVNHGEAPAAIRYRWKGGEEEMRVVPPRDGAVYTRTIG